MKIGLEPMLEPCPPRSEQLHWGTRHGALAAVLGCLGNRQLLLLWPWESKERAGCRQSRLCSLPTFLNLVCGILWYQERLIKSSGAWNGNTNVQNLYCGIIRLNFFTSGFPVFHNASNSYIGQLTTTNESNEKSTPIMVKWTAECFKMPCKPICSFMYFFVIWKEEKQREREDFENKVTYVD